MLGQLIAEARNAGAADMLPYALVRLAGVELDTGRWRAAAAALAEAERIRAGDGQQRRLRARAGHARLARAARGHVEACRAHAEEALELAGRFGNGSRLDRAAAALGLLELGCGRPEPAIALLEDIRRVKSKTGWSDAALTPHRLPDLVEAYALAGSTAETPAALDVFERTRAYPSPVCTRARGSMPCVPGARFRAPRPLHRRLGAGVEATGPFERARTELLYGSRLARLGATARRRISSRALQAFGSSAPNPGPTRARRDRRCRRHPPRSHPNRLERLTPLELEVALAAAAGAPLDDVAHGLFLGPRTVRLLQASTMASSASSRRPN